MDRSVWSSLWGKQPLQKLKHFLENTKPRWHVSGDDKFKNLNFNYQPKLSAESNFFDR